MYQYGVVAEIKQVMRVSDDLVRILVEGKFRAKRTELDTEGSFLLASVRPAPVRPIKAEEETEAEALLRNVKTSFDAVLSMNPRISKDVVFAVTSNNDPAFLCEYIPANLLFRFEDKQAVMEESTLIGRLRLLVERLHRERRMLEIDKEIAQKVDEAMDKNQRDYYLHEQMHMISQELGEDDDTTQRPRSTAAGSRSCIWTRNGRRNCSRKWTALPRCRAATRRERSSEPIWTPAWICPGTALPRTTSILPRPSASLTATTTV